MPKIDSNILSSYEVDEDSFSFQNAKKFLTAKRFDLTAKCIYVRHKLSNVGFDWAEKIYHDHLYYWDIGNIHEFDGSKKSYKDFKESFDKLIVSFQKNGFDAEKGTIPVLADNTIVNGAHRVACALILNKEICTVSVKGPDHNYPYKFFQMLKIPESVLATMLLEYTLQKSSVRVAVIFPDFLTKYKTTYNLLADLGNVIAEKDYMLSEIAMVNLLHILYEGEPWLHVGKGITPSVMSHINKRYSDKKPVRFVFIDCKGNDQEIMENSMIVKKKIRALFNDGNYPIHINDSYAETISMACQLLHEPSLDLLSRADTYRAKNFLSFVRKMKKDIPISDWHKFVIDSGGVLAAYGLRDTNDIDYIETEELNSLKSLKFCAPHNVELKLYNMPSIELVLDPRNFVYFLGLKIVSPELLIKMKSLRKEEKDIRDIELLKMALEKNYTPSFTLKRREIIKYTLFNIAQKVVPSFVGKGMKKVLPKSVLNILRKMFRKIVI